MDLHERQQFDFLLLTAVDRYTERLEQHNEGAANAVERLRADRNGGTVRAPEFVDALFEDFLLNNADGACFVLRALAAKPGIGPALIAMAKSAFADLLCAKTEENLEQHSRYGA